MAPLPAASSSRVPVSVAGRNLAVRYDRMDVTKHWLPGVHVEWKTGDPDGKKGGPPTHCSLFVAAACLRLNVPMLAPPPQDFLSNQQQRWLLTEGRKRGWVRLRNGLEAQKLANQGAVVVASYRNPNAKKAGHIALVRPAEVSVAQVQQSGPRICQAGARNYNNASLKTGFRNHRGAFARNQVLFFAYRPLSR